MANIIKADNGASSGVTGIVQSGDSSGQLALQTTTSSGTATTALTIDNSQNVGIGVTPSAWSQGKVVEVGSLGNAFWGYSANQNFITQNAYYNGSAWKYTGTNAATYYTQGSGAHYWYAAPSGTAGNTATFNGLMTLNNSGTLVFAQSGQGIQFTNSSALTNSTLNDYETGTWTPSVGGTATYIAQNGIYTKVGNIVSVKGTFTINAIGTGSTAAISGLPFTSATTTGSPTAQVVFGYWASLSTSVTYLGGYVNTSANTIYFVTTTGNQSTITNNPNVLQSGSRVDFSAVYQANF